jgi:hypothetical protein
MMIDAFLAFILESLCLVWTAAKLDSSPLYLLFLYYNCFSFMASLSFLLSHFLSQ